MDGGFMGENCSVLVFLVGKEMRSKLVRTAKTIVLDLLTHDIN